MTVIVRILGRRVRIETLPPPARPRLRWDGSDQAVPFSPLARAGQAFRRFAVTLAELTDGPPPRPRPDYLRRHL